MGIMNAPMMLAASSGDDVDFMVHGLIPLKFFGHKVWITTTHVTTLIVMVFIIVLALIARHAVLHGDEKPSGLQNFVEMIVEMLDNLVKGSMGRHWRPFVNYIGTIMVFIFFANTSGLFGLRPPTADYGTTLALALKQANGNRKVAAELLGIGRTTLYSKLEEYGLKYKFRQS